MKTKSINKGRILSLERCNNYNFGNYNLNINFLKDETYNQTEKTSKISIIEEIDWLNLEKWRVANNSASLSIENGQVVLHFGQINNMIHYEGFILYPDFSFVIRVKIKSETGYLIGITNKTSFQQFPSGTLQGYHLVEYSFPDCSWYVDGVYQGKIADYVWFDEKQHIFFKRVDETELIYVTEIAVDTYRTLPIYSENYEYSDSLKNWFIQEYKKEYESEVSYPYQHGIEYDSNGNETIKSKGVDMGGLVFTVFKEPLPTKHGQIADGTLKATLHMDSSKYWNIGLCEINKENFINKNNVSFEEVTSSTILENVMTKRYSVNRTMLNQGINPGVHSFEIRIWDNIGYVYIDNTDTNLTIDLSNITNSELYFFVYSSGQNITLLDLMYSPFVQSIPIE
ncbi:hypothetical protein [Methanosphaera sp.]|uniref:hypothetical protein n=1 Tax=Methanosphaera sp. TaxID=2666342 RepID=UPI0025F49E82|nr:hypothetical protein [Methanosphaera sp.]